MTFGAPSGAFGGSNGFQSGTESRMSTLILPLNGSVIVRCSTAPRLGASPPSGDASRAPRRDSGPAPQQAVPTSNDKRETHGHRTGPTDRARLQGAGLPR